MSFTRRTRLLLGHLVLHNPVVVFKSRIPCQVFTVLVFGIPSSLCMVVPLFGPCIRKTLGMHPVGLVPLLVVIHFLITSTVFGLIILLLKASWRVPLLILPILRLFLPGVLLVLVPRRLLLLERLLVHLRLVGELGLRGRDMVGDMGFLLRVIACRVAALPSMVVATIVARLALTIGFTSEVAGALHPLIMPLILGLFEGLGVGVPLLLLFGLGAVPSFPPVPLGIPPTRNLDSVKSVDRTFFEDVVYSFLVLELYEPEPLALVSGRILDDVCCMNLSEPLEEFF